MLLENGTIHRFVIYLYIERIRMMNGELWTVLNDTGDGKYKSERFSFYCERADDGMDGEMESVRDGKRAATTWALATFAIFNHIRFRAIVAHPRGCHYSEFFQVTNRRHFCAHCEKLLWTYSPHYNLRNDERKVFPKFYRCFAIFRIQSQNRMHGTFSLIIRIVFCQA